MKQAFVTTVLGFLLAAGSVSGSEPQYRVQRGDTLWDLSGRFWNDVWAWPELWALNPHFRNPHWIYPGDPIFLGRPEPTTRVVRLPLERLVPGEGAGVTEPGKGEAETPEGRLGERPGDEARMVRLARLQTLDFIAPQRLSRVGTVDNLHQVKVAYAAGEDIEFALAPDSQLEPGDMVTLVDDRERVLHPVSGRWEGYYVRVLGHLEVLAVHEGRGVGRIVETYAVVEDGDGIVPYREPIREMPLRELHVDVAGVILRGEPEQFVFSTDDMVFLDRGKSHGLEPGVLLEISVREGERAAQGLVDLGSPLAVLFVVSVEEESAACVIVESRAAVEAGDRFTVASFSP